MRASQVFRAWSTEKLFEPSVETSMEQDFVGMKNPADRSHHDAHLTNFLSDPLTSVQKVTINQLTNKKQDTYPTTIDIPTTMKFQDIKIQEDNFRASDADLQAEKTPVVAVDNKSTTTKNESTRNNENDEALPYQYVPLRMGGNGGTHKPSEASRALIENEVSLDDLKRMTNKFYEYAFQDETLDKFIRSHGDPHGDRFAKWIHQKLTGSHVWDDDRRTRDLSPHELSGGRSIVVHDRTSAHVAAWNSVKRSENDVGRHFTLEECRVWMRLHFWAMRESGVVEQSPSFADYYVRFIGHFVAVYERSATIFARESFRWSANPENTKQYIANGRKMTDVLGVRFQQAINDVPEEELNEEGDWPYNVAAQQ